MTSGGYQQNDSLAQQLNIFNHKKKFKPKSDVSFVLLRLYVHFACSEHRPSICFRYQLLHVPLCGRLVGWRYPTPRSSRKFNWWVEFENYNNSANLQLFTAAARVRGASSRTRLKRFNLRKCYKFFFVPNSRLTFPPTRRSSIPGTVPANRYLARASPQSSHESRMPKVARNVITVHSVRFWTLVCLSDFFCCSVILPEKAKIPLLIKGDAIAVTK